MKEIVISLIEQYVFLLSLWAVADVYGFSWLPPVYLLYMNIGALSDILYYINSLSQPHT